MEDYQSVTTALRAERDALQVEWQRVDDKLRAVTDAIEALAVLAGEAPQHKKRGRPRGSNWKPSPEHLAAMAEGRRRAAEAAKDAASVQ